MKILNCGLDSERIEILKKNYVEPIFEPVFRPKKQKNYNSVKCFCICDCGCDKVVKAVVSFSMTTPITLVDAG